MDAHDLLDILEYGAPKNAPAEKDEHKVREAAAEGLKVAVDLLSALDPRHSPVAGHVFEIYAGCVRALARARRDGRAEHLREAASLLEPLVALDRAA